MDALHGKRLLILGLARQGKALARFAVAAGARVIVSDLRSAEQLSAAMAELAELPISYVLGEHPLSLLDDCDLIALSGSVAADLPLVRAARARQIPLTNDGLEFMRRVPATVVGITGSAGKTTSTALVGAIGQAAGRTTWVGGNIGNPLITDLDQMQAGDLVAMELSSFQLELWDVSPPVAAVLNVTPNHLDRHKTMAAYTAAKANILRYQTGSDTAVLSADDPGAASLAPTVRGRCRLFSQRAPVQDGALVRQGQIWLRDGQRETAVMPLAEIKLRGAHNVLNVLAAVALADAVGLPLMAMRQAIAAFAGVEHRLELVDVIDGVTYVNDSIATAPERALAALAAFAEPLLLLAGGRDKDLHWDDWVQCVGTRAKAVILFGELAELLANKLQAAGQPQPVVQVDDLTAAVATAAALAESGDIVLLSPGGTSYDAYLDFAERGEHFRRLVAELRSAQAASAPEPMFAGK
jgi:UDP-N-acetylmuramoylalanine--D-glutamate ligase